MFPKGPNIKHFFHGGGGEYILNTKRGRIIVRKTHQKNYDWEYGVYHGLGVQHLITSAQFWETAELAARDALETVRNLLQQEIMALAELDHAKNE